MAKFDLSDKSMDELEEIHRAVMDAKEKQTVAKQNEIIERYKELREEMVKWGVAKDEDLPRFKQRGWSRKTQTAQ
tara:strand:- start:536 stop:760 length:225 start_codon:yes stop_codon:yes gene_type:complete